MESWMSRRMLYVNDAWLWIEAVLVSLIDSGSYSMLANLHFIIILSTICSLQAQALV